MSGYMDLWLSQPSEASARDSIDREAQDAAVPDPGVSFSVVFALLGWLILVICLRAA